MPISQNVRFSGEAPRDAEFEHPHGASIARQLEANLNRCGWSVAPFDNWRDVGWQLLCCKADTEIEITFSEFAEAQWMLQVAPTYMPGLWGRLLRRRRSAEPRDCLNMAKDVHQLLISSERYTDFKWCWDGFPNDVRSTSEPQESVQPRR